MLTLRGRICRRKHRKHFDALEIRNRKQNTCRGWRARKVAYALSEAGSGSGNDKPAVVKGGHYLLTRITSRKRAEIFILFR